METNKQRLELVKEFEQLPPQQDAPLSPIILSPSMLKPMIAAIKQMASSRTHHSELWTNFARRITRKVVIAPSPDGETAELTIHGHLAAILAAQEAWREASKDLRREHSQEFARKRAAGAFKTLDDKVRFLDRCQAIMSQKEKEWMSLQVSVVAGAGFEPAAFRL